MRGGHNRGTEVHRMRFEWDHEKAASNRRKHRVSFHEASTVFGDRLAITFNDPDHTLQEMRFLTFGLSCTARLLIVSHTQRFGRIRIISARLATRRERKIYEEG